MSDDGYALSEGDFSPSSVASLDSILRSQVYSPEVDSPLVRDDDATPRRGRRDAPWRPVTHARRLALDARRETLGDSHAATLSSCNNLAVLLSEARKFEDALPLLMEAFEGYRAQRGLTHPSTASLVVNVSQVLFVVPLQTEGLDAEQAAEASWEQHRKAKKITVQSCPPNSED